MAVKKTTKKTKRIRVPRTRNNETMTESAFWGFIRSALRRKSMYWKPVAQAKKNAKRDYKGPNKRQKFAYLCNGCKKLFKDKEVNVDHIIPAGTLRSAKDLPVFVENLFCEVDNLQVLCDLCHNKKTQKERKK